MSISYADVPDVGSLPRLGIEEAPVTPTAPDGAPWRKCCGECQFRDRRSIEDVEADCADASAAFYCVHRQDGAHFRVCAGFAARASKRQAAEATP